MCNRQLTWEKYAGNTQRWSSNREHWTRSSNSNRSCVVPRKRSGLVVSSGGDFGTPLFGWLPATHAPTCWRLQRMNKRTTVSRWILIKNMQIMLQVMLQQQKWSNYTLNSENTFPKNITKFSIKFNY